jgi:hypothetical protein
VRPLRHGFCGCVNLTSYRAPFASRQHDSRKALSREGLYNRQRHGSDDQESFDKPIPIFTTTHRHRANYGFITKVSLYNRQRRRRDEQESSDKPISVFTTTHGRRANYEFIMEVSVLCTTISVIFYLRNLCDFRSFTDFRKFSKFRELFGSSCICKTLYIFFFFLQILWNTPITGEC